MTPKNPNTPHPSPLPQGERGPLERVACLDAFRGFVITTMVFVNYVAGISNVPGWLKHVPPDVKDGYTLVDVVFPGFLFIVGVSIPLALKKRLEAGASVLNLMGHALDRAASLLFLGVVMENAGSLSVQATVLSRNTWMFFFYLSIFALWMIYPRETPSKWVRAFAGIRGGAFLILSLLILILRSKHPAPQGAWIENYFWWGLLCVMVLSSLLPVELEPGLKGPQHFVRRGFGLVLAAVLFCLASILVGGSEQAWFRHSWWGILGVIGWCYLTAVFAYLLTAGNGTALMGVFLLMLALYIGGRHGALPSWFDHINGFVGVSGIFGSHSAEVVAGILVGRQFALPSSPASRLKFFIWFGVLCYASGILLRPLHGISKLGGTESWILVCAGECALILALFYWLMDVRGWKAWAAALVPVGMNPLLAYFLPDFLNKVLNIVASTGLKPWGWFWHSWSGWSGVANSAAMTLLICVLTWLATRKKLILKL